MSHADALIVGGGISGLAAAWWLARQGIAVEVWEAAARAGGKIGTHHQDGYTTEQAAGLLVNFRPEIDTLIQQAGLDSSLTRRDDHLNRYIVHQGKLTQVPMLLPALLHSPLWSPSAKLRLLAEPFIPRGSGESESVSAFVRRRLGQEVLDTAMDPFITGTLASDPDLAEAQSVLPRLTALENRYGSLTAGMLVNKILKRRRANTADTFSFQGGMSELVDTLARTPGVTVRCGARATGIIKQDNQWLVEGDVDGVPNRLRVPQLVISTPADVSGTLLRPLDSRLGNLLCGIEYSPVAVLHLGLKSSSIKHPLDGSGFLVPKKGLLPINGNLWMSSLFPERAPAGHTLLTTYLGGVHHPEQLHHSDEQLMETVLECLHPLLDIRGSVDYIKVERHHRGLPLYHGRYSARIGEIEGHLMRHSGLHLSANYMHGVSVRERIFQGKQVADKIATALMASGDESLAQLPLAAAR
ncbi:MAG: protoporphyrinogen oxidase [Pseudomonadota bacterium]